MSLRVPSEIFPSGDAPEEGVDYPDKSPLPDVFPNTAVDYPDRKPQSQEIYERVSKESPDEVARVMKVSRELYVDPAFAKANLDVLEKTKPARPGSFFVDMERRFPGLTKFATKPENMAM